MNLKVELNAGYKLEEALRDRGVENPTMVSKLSVVDLLSYEDCDYIRTNMSETLLELDLSETTTVEWHKPMQVVFIWDGALRRCVALQSVIIGDKITEIGVSAFRECTALRTVFIGVSVETIHEEAFNGCKALETVTIPASVRSVKRGAFADCPAVLSVHPDNPELTIIKGKIKKKSFIKRG